MTRRCRVHSLVMMIASLSYGLCVMGCETRESRSGDVVNSQGKVAKLTVTSPAFEHGGSLPVEFTCDGAGVSPPIKWSGAPADTKSYALQLWHVAKDGETKSYWVVYNIPAEVTSLPKNAKGIGKDGHNGKKKTGYDPMCSKGPGVKEYHVTVYALSAEPKFASAKVNRADLLAAIKDITVAQGTLSFKYERPAGKAGK